jgi:hypothetical protein
MNKIAFIVLIAIGISGCQTPLPERVSATKGLLTTTPPKYAGQFSSADLKNSAVAVIAGANMEAYVEFSAKETKRVAELGLLSAELQKYSNNSWSPSRLALAAAEAVMPYAKSVFAADDFVQARSRGADYAIVFDYFLKHDGWKTSTALATMTLYSLKGEVILEASAQVEKYYPEPDGLFPGQRAIVMHYADLSSAHMREINEAITLDFQQKVRSR